MQVHEVTLLLVDDDPAVRRVSRRVLERAGYRVVTAEDGETGIRAWEAERERISLVITDLHMPRAGGAELAERLRGADPALPLLYLTACPDEGVAAADRSWLARFPPVLTKPFAAGDLVAMVRSGLALAEAG